MVELAVGGEELELEVVVLVLHGPLPLVPGSPAAGGVVGVVARCGTIILWSPYTETYGEVGMSQIYSIFILFQATAMFYLYVQCFWVGVDRGFGKCIFNIKMEYKKLMCFVCIIKTVFLYILSRFAYKVS